MTITIIGLGLIGGSIALDLRSQLCISVLGVDNNKVHQKEAIDLGLVDGIVSLAEGISVADVVIVATPVDSIEYLLPTVLDEISNSTIVTDVGSTKGAICQQVAQHRNRNRYVAAHPLAGTEFSGPQAALAGLFRGKKNIICDRELSDSEAVDKVQALFSSIGMTTYFMNSTEHDRHLAYVSHLSHVTSFTLGLTVLDIEQDERQIFNLASTGFESTARLAKSNPKTWAAIFDRNSEYVTEALDGYIAKLTAFRAAIHDKDTAMMIDLMAEANDIKRVLKKNRESKQTES